MNYFLLRSQGSVGIKRVAPQKRYLGIVWAYSHYRPSTVTLLLSVNDSSDLWPVASDHEQHASSHIVYIPLPVGCNSSYQYDKISRH